MAENKLKEGISMLYNMEMNNYMMNRSINELEDEIAGLGIKGEYIPPQREWNQFAGGWTDGIWISLGSLFFPIIPCVCGAAIWIIAFIFSLIFGFYDSKTMAMIVFGFSIVTMIVVQIICMMLPILIPIIKKKKEDKRIEEDYLWQCVQFEQTLAEDRIRVHTENKEKQILIQEKLGLEARLAEAEEKLDKYYETIGIDKKFRNLVPVGYMDEFIRLGISTKLEGADGLYYLIMKELRWDQVNCSLNDISNKMDVIVDNQRALYGELLEINNKCSQLVSSARESARLQARQQETLDSINRNSALTAYYQERTYHEMVFDNMINNYNQ